MKFLIKDGMKNKYSIVIFGTGSIGRRHYKIGSNIKKCQCSIFSRSTYRNNELRKSGYSIFDFKKKYDLGIIATESSNHFYDFEAYNKYADKWIIEKPLISIYSNNKIEFLNFKNNLYVGYNKRFELGIKELKKFSLKNKIYKAHFKCFSNLENWRNENISKSISLKKEKGGGVINELSHEIDLANYLLGSINNIDGFAKQRKYKKSNVEDTAFLKLEHKNGSHSKIDLSFGCSKEIRKVIFYCENKKIIYDHLNGDMFEINKSSKCLLNNFKENRDKSFERQIKCLLEDDYTFATPCSSYDGLSYIKLSKHLAWK